MNRPSPSGFSRAAVVWNGARAKWLLIAAMLAGLAPGCASMRSMFRPAPQAPVVFEGTPASTQLLETIRANAVSVRQLESDIRITMDGMPAGIRGSLLVEQPSRLRLKAGVLGMTDTGIDIGTNEERFWIFNKSSYGGQTPAIYYARHGEFRNSQVQRMIPLQPQWLIEAIGLIDPGKLSDIQGPFVRNDGFLEMRGTTETPSGTFHRLLAIDPRRGWLVQQAIYDQAGQLVAWSKSSDFRYFPEVRASLPGHVELNLAGNGNQSTKLSISLQTHTINKLFVDPAVTWNMPTPADVPAVDLSTLDPAGLERIMSGDLSSAAARPMPAQMAQLRGFELQ